MDHVALEEGDERLKVILPVERNWLLYSLFSVCLLVWIAMFAGVILAMFREHFGFLLDVMLLVWLAVWFWFGRVLWRRWQYFAADREILFINEQQILVRRPVSILGTTDVYDMRHVSPFYFSDKHHCPAFDYAYQHVYFGQSLLSDVARELVSDLNQRYFPDLGDD
jgi:hypothetical protein